MPVYNCVNGGNHMADVTEKSEKNIKAPLINVFYENKTEWFI